MDIVIQEIMEKYKDLQETDNTYLMQKEKLKVLNKGPLEYKIIDQRFVSTTATLTFTLDNIVATGHINSWDSKTLEKKLYEVLYKQIIPNFCE